MTASRRLPVYLPLALVEQLTTERNSTAARLYLFRLR
jgi:hypothetical protein